MQTAHQWGYFDGTTLRPVPKDADMPTQVEEDAMEAWDHEDAVACYLLSQRLPDSIMFQVGKCPTACTSWEQVAEHCKKERAWDLPEEAFVAMKHEGRRTRLLHRSGCITCCFI
jgi:hypothetical protein